MKRISGILLLTVLLLNQTAAQTSLVNTQGSSYAKLTGVGISDVSWTKGFWAERFAVCCHSCGKLIPAKTFVFRFRISEWLQD
jgi:hypothetical protein